MTVDPLAPVERLLDFRWAQMAHGVLRLPGSPLLPLLLGMYSLREGVPVSAYEQGRRSYKRWLKYGGNREGIFLAGLDVCTTDDQRADYEDGWIDASDETEDA